MCVLDAARPNGRYSPARYRSFCSSAAQKTQSFFPRLPWIRFDQFLEMPSRTLSRRREAVANPEMNSRTFAKSSNTSGSSARGGGIHAGAFCDSRYYCAVRFAST